MQIIRIFIIAIIIAFVPVLALPVGVESQELVSRSGLPSIRKFIERARKVIQSLLRNQKKPTRSSVEKRELGVIYAREDADDISIRGLDDDIYARLVDEFEAREFDGELDSREPQSVVF
jgi:hypothetical protein